MSDGSPIELHADVDYRVVSLPAGASFEWPVEEDQVELCYVTDGDVSVDDTPLQAGEFAVKEETSELTVAIDAEVDTTFALVTGRPLGEPITQRGPVVL